MLCAVCLSMFSRDEAKGTHHTCLTNLQTAAEGGCKICIALHMRRNMLGSDPEAEEAATPFLEYLWKPCEDRMRLQDGSCGWNIQFDSDIRWLKWGIMPWNRVDIYATYTSEPVPDWYLDVSKHAACDLDSEPWRVRRELFPLRPIPDSTGHREVLVLAKAWLQSCENTHDCENLRGRSASNWYPKRLVDITDTALPRLLETQSERPCSPYRYATLSHCWGSNPDFITLTTENFAGFCKGVAIDSLPRSFRDAIVVCNHLDIRYIWIDSLCILQDSHSDWLLHAVEMSSVYQNCHLNLSFDVAENPRQGAFTRRNTDLLQDCYAFSTIPGDLDLANMRSADSSSSESESSGIVSDGPPDTSHSDKDSQEGSSAEVDSAKGDSVNPTRDALRFLVFAPGLDYGMSGASHLPLSRRGWVVQERLLSPRVLHFMDDRIRWECDCKSSLHEGLPHGLPDIEDYFNHAIDTFDCFPERYTMGSKRQHFVHWANIVRMYSQRLLTYPEKDKLVALAAVAQRFAAVFSEEYYAGHFRENMPFDLCWEVIGRKSGQDSSVRRYPTWSWTSVDAEVWPGRIPDGSGQAVAIVECVNVILEDRSYKYGPVIEGELVLRCLVIKCDLGPRRDSLEETGPFKYIRSVLLQEEMGYDKFSFHTHLCIHLDTPEEEGLTEVFLIPLVGCTSSVGSRRRSKVFEGIILLKETDGRYRRVGSWDSDLWFELDLDNGHLVDYIDRNSQNHQQVVIV